MDPRPNSNGECLTRAPILDRLTHGSAAAGRPKYGDYQGKVGALDLNQRPSAPQPNALLGNRGPVYTGFRIPMRF